MVSPLLLSALSIAYLALLFAVAFFGERKSVYPAQAALRPYIYSLALGVYCTTWTFFGAVGTAVRSGWAYLPIYLGPVLVFILATPFLHRLISIVRSHNITSIADLVSSRFGKSPALAALITVIALTAAVPYLALQYKAVGTSIDVLTGSDGTHPDWYADTALWVALMMALFAILFGTRRLDVTEHHEGVMLAIAFESVVKLLAFAAVAAFALLKIDGLSLSDTRLGEFDTLFSANFAVSMILGAAAIFCLPRQFHMGVVECANPADLRKARWIFPAYLAIFTVCVVPVVIAGLGSGLGEVSNPDSFVLTLPLASGATGLALLAFLGGLSAATAMVIVASIALATMITNDLVMPALWRSRWLAISESADIGKVVLRIRRTAILLLALLAYGYHRNIPESVSLASIGLLAFAAVAQFAPAILAGLYWRGATRSGVASGLAAGFAVWLYALFLPNLASGGAVGKALIESGPWGLSWLRPGALFGIEFMTPQATGAVVALACNVAVMVMVSRFAGLSLKERMAAKSFVSGALPVIATGGAGGARVGDLLAVMERILGAEYANAALRDYCAEKKRDIPRASAPADRGLLQYMERELAGAIGSSSARLMFSHALRGRGMAAEDVADLLDETAQELRFSRQLLQATMENVSQGIAVADSDARIVAWNRRYLEMLDYPEDMVFVGRPIADLIRWNTERGEFSDDDADQQITKRLAHMRAGTSYTMRRNRRNGRVYEMHGQSMPGGGYVTTYTDITEFKRNEQALLETKQTLEQRVSERTWELQSALEAQRRAKRAAEEANLTKTRFVAAASHDLLQPLNAARLFASALEERLTDPELRQLAGRIDTSMRAAEEVLDDMLDIARLESGAMRAELTDFAVEELLQELSVQFGPLAKRRGLQLRFAKSTCFVRSDRVLLRRVLQNLISNALRYTEQGSVLIGCRRRQGYSYVQVWDTGPGISEDNQRAIFGEFQRLDRSSHWEEHGLGLGLSICDRIARLLDLRLDLRSRVGYGSVFSVRVPLASRQSAQLAKPESATVFVHHASRLTGLRVLCIDNEVQILDGMRALMSRWGIEVLTATHSAEAIEVAARQAPDVILADYRLDEGEVDGLTLLQQICRTGAESIPGGLITADYGADVAERTRALGYPLLRKPIKPAALRALLTAMAGTRKRAATATGA
jgi:PAS domain S-box-containing protein